MLRLASLALVLLTAHGARADTTSDPCSAAAGGKCTTITVYGRGARVALDTLDSAGGTAWGSYIDGAGRKSDFGSLSLQSSANATDADQMYAVGFAEGVLTQHRIYEEVVNLREPVLVHYGRLPSTDPKDFPALTRWLDENDAYVRAEVARNGDKDPFWRGLGLILAQYDGLVAGYRHAAPAHEALQNFDFQMLNGVGDLFDLIPAVMPQLRRDFKAMTRAQLHDYTLDSGRCSGLIKLLGDFSELFFSHTSWWSYASMIRMMKHYNTPLHDSAVRARQVSFSSYPGFLESLDDFYIMADGGSATLAMVQTTNNVFNTSLYDLVTPSSVLAWQRVRVASLLAGDGAAWHERMRRENSGTYENQYMVLDLSKFTPGQPLAPGTLWVGEQIPGTYVYGDVTEQLARGYWPSYNVPYWPEIYNKSGYPDVVQRTGPEHSYELAPRAKIFRRDQGKVVDMTSFKRIMRYNDYQHDPFSAGDPGNAICARGDLRNTSASAGGCLDCKVSSYTQAKRLQSEVVNGPTSVASSFGPGQAPFRWSENPAFENMSHVGMPDAFGFVFETVEPQWTP